MFYLQPTVVVSLDVFQFPSCALTHTRSLVHSVVLIIIVSHRHRLFRRLMTVARRFCFHTNHLNKQTRVYKSQVSFGEAHKQAIAAANVFTNIRKLIPKH